MLEGALWVIPDARVGHLGLKRDEESLEATCYYTRVPAQAGEGTVLLLDPMLATGGTATQALDTLRAEGCRDVRFVCLVAAPEGVRRVTAAHAVPIYAAALDRELDVRGYIRPGLGDAGDRSFWTS
jgi:uracil phosphoribosyltransferase